MNGNMILSLWVYSPAIAFSFLVVAFYTITCILLHYMLKRKIKNIHILGVVVFILPLIPFLILSNSLTNYSNHYAIFSVITAIFLVITSVSFIIVLVVKTFNLNSIVFLTISIIIALWLSVMVFLYYQAFQAQSAISSCAEKFQENPNYGVNESLLKEKYPLIGDSSGAYSFTLEFGIPNLEKGVWGSISSCTIERKLLITVYKENVKAVVLDSVLRIPLAQVANDKTFLEFVEEKISDIYLEELNNELWIMEGRNPKLDSGDFLQVSSGPYTYSSHKQKFLSVDGGTIWVKNGTAEFRDLVR